MLRILESENGEKEHHPNFIRQKRMKSTPPVASGDLKKNAFPKGRHLPRKREGNNDNGASQSTKRANRVRPYGEKEHHPVPKRRDLGFAFVSHSDDHPVGFADGEPLF
jgi:hypothetical protein